MGSVGGGEERCARRGALGVVIELREEHAFGSEPVDVGGLDFPAVTAQVRPAHVVGHDEDDVGTGRFRGGVERKAGCQETKERGEQ